MSDCDLSSGECPACGFASERRDLRRNCPASATSQPVAFEYAALAPPPRPGLGDYIAAGLAWLGITKPRVEALVGGPCGCGERQEALNAWGRETLGIGRPDAPSGSD